MGFLRFGAKEKIISFDKDEDKVVKAKKQTRSNKESKSEAIGSSKEKH